MKKTRVASHLSSLFALTFLVGCLTLNVNVNFPESAVQQATDSYVADLYRQKGKGKPAKSESSETVPDAQSPADRELDSSNKSPEKKSDQKTDKKTDKKSDKKANTSSHSILFARLGSLVLISDANAGETKINIDSPKAAKIKEKLASNVSEVLANKRTGILGETNDGKLIIKDASKLKKLLQKKIEKLVQDENSAREELYKEVVASNQATQGHLIDVKKSFARSFQTESPDGTWIQDDDGSWKQKGE